MIKKSTTNAQGFEKLESSKLSKLNYVYKNSFEPIQKMQFLLSPSCSMLLYNAEHSLFDD